ncbi:MAG: hypothetical protein WBF16_10970 [Candidatus Deferrimicrobiaceae bacterium]
MKVPAVCAIAGLIILATNVVLTISVSPWNRIARLQRSGLFRFKIQDVLFDSPFPS